MTRQNKIFIADLIRTGLTVLFGITVYVIATTVPAFTLLGIYLSGVIITHAWIMRGLARPDGTPVNYFNWQAYRRDSGIALVVFGWFMFMTIYIVPMIAGGFARRILGVKPNE